MERDPAEAIRLLEQVVSGDPANAWARYLLRELEGEATSPPTGRSTHFERARYFESIGNIESARHHYDAASLDKGFTWTFHDLERLRKRGPQV